MLVPFFAAAAAKPLQIGLMRADELVEGVVVRDPLGLELGHSRVAGWTAVGQTVFTRTLYLAPPMVLPPLLMAYLARTFPSPSPLVKAALTTVNVVFIASMSAFATPACIALFDQQATLPVSSLESRFQGALGADGNPVRRVVFNKGL